jgi:hypothetical protein
MPRFVLTPASRMSRRALLRRGAVVVGVGGLGYAGVSLYGHAGRYPEPEAACKLLYLERREYAIVAALALALFPPGNPLGIDGIQARVPEYIDRLLAGMEPHKAKDLKSMFLLFEHGTLAFGLRVRRFTELPPRARERYLRRWERSRVYSRRMLAAALKSMLGMGYFAHPEVQASLGMERLCGTVADTKPRDEWS